MPGSLVFFKVMGWEVNGTTITQVMQSAFAGVGSGHHRFAGLAQATEKLICHHWEQSKRGRHGKGFVCLHLCEASGNAQGNRVWKCRVITLSCLCQLVTASCNFEIHYKF